MTDRFSILSFLVLATGLTLSCSTTPHSKDEDRFPAGQRSGLISSVDPHQISGLQKAADVFIASLPDSSIKRGLRRYFEVIGLDAYEDQNPGHANHGLNRFLADRIEKNWCFGKLSSEFAVDQFNIDEQIWKLHQSELSSRPLKRRMSLADEAGRSVPELKPGWLWQKALRFSGQDPNLAISLLGVCGHDDTAQGPYEYFDQSLEAISVAKKKGPPFPDNGVVGEVFCPQKGSLFFLPASLGQGWDLSPELKKKISLRQGSPQGAWGLPAKYYHVYGSAFASCQMIQEGMPAALAEKIQVEASRFYRGIRICNKVNELSSLRDKLFASYQRSMNLFGQASLEEMSAPRGTPSFMTFDQWLREQVRLIQTDPNCHAPLYPNISPPWEQVSKWTDQERSQFQIQVKDSVREYEQKRLAWKQSHEARCSLLAPKVSLAELMKSSPDQTQGLVFELLVDVNAADLYRRWFIGSQNIFGKQIPCTDVQLFGPRQLLPSPAEIQNQTNRCSWEYSAMACNQARRRLAAWANDFEWTAAQHKLGAQFASRVCRSEAPGQYPEQRACKALEQAPQVEHPEQLLGPSSNPNSSK